ncbi:hypothetical protein MTO96_027406 [Rhipicephalus appendiculatus]
MILKEKRTTGNTLTPEDTRVTTSCVLDNKFSYCCDPHPYTVTNVYGSQITASRDRVSICRNASFFEDVSTVQVKQHQTQTDKPDLDDAAVPSHGAALPDQAIPTPLNTVSQRYPQRTQRRPGHLEDCIVCSQVNM